MKSITVHTEREFTTEEKQMFVNFFENKIEDAFGVSFQVDGYNFIDFPRFGYKAYSKTVAKLYRNVGLQAC